MKASLLTALLMSSIALSGNAHASLLSRIIKNPLKNQKANVNDVFSGVTFNYLDRQDRSAIVTDFLTAVDAEYALLPLKAERIGLDFQKLKADALADEASVDDVLLNAKDRKDPDLRERAIFRQAQSNMDFLDRMQALVSKFKDTHFSVEEKIPRPMIYNGLRFFRVQDKIIVGSLENKLLGASAKLSGADFSSIAIGDEVISIDGVPVEDKITELKKYLGASSDEFSDSMAVRALTIRNFKYEKKNYVKIAFKNAGTFKLPIFANIPNDSMPRLDALAYFKKMEIPTDSASIGMTFDQTSRKWVDSALSFEGFSTRKLHLNLKGVIEMLGDDGTPAIRTGYYMSKGKTYGVLQLLTFATKNVKIGDKQLTFLDAIRGYVSELKETELPMILDLRVNGGGNGNYPSAVLSILSEPKAQYASETYGLRMTHFSRQMQDSFLFQELPGEDLSQGISMDDFKGMLSNSIDNGLQYSPMYTNGSSIGADAKVKGFNNRIVALVTADCISACDMMSILLKSSKRATIIGSHANGTGAGYRSTTTMNTNWEDRFRMFSSHIPNFLFGMPGSDVEKMIFEDGSVSKLCSENLPTVADIPYSTTMLDVARNNIGWLQKAAEVIETKK